MLFCTASYFDCFSSISCDVHYTRTVTHYQLQFFWELYTIARCILIFFHEIKNFLAYVCFFLFLFVACGGARGEGDAECAVHTRVSGGSAWSRRRSMEASEQRWCKVTTIPKYHRGSSYVSLALRKCLPPYSLKWWFLQWCALPLRSHVHIRAHLHANSRAHLACLLVLCFLLILFFILFY